MNINITSMKFERLESGNIRLSLKNDDKDSEYDTFYVISKVELPDVLKCLRGTADYYPCFYDGLYLLRFHPKGLTAYEVNPPHGKIRYFTFLGEAWANALELFYKSPNNEWVASDDFIRWHKNAYRPRAKFVWYDNCQLGAIKALPDERLSQALNGLLRIAHNYSDGQINVIDISYDDWNGKDLDKPSFYFNIHTPDGKRIMNGGIIAHKYNDKVEYSTHT
jgi:hypothetical protein